MVGMLDNAIIFLSQLGFLSVVIPFIFAFTLVFALLQKTLVLGKDSLRYNAIVAFVFGFMFVYFVNLQSLLYFVFYIVLLIIGSIMFLFIIKMVGFKEFKKKERQWILVGIFAFLTIVLTRAYVDWELVKDVLINPATISLAVFVLVLWFIVGRPGRVRKEAETEERAQRREETREPERQREAGPPRPPGAPPQQRRPPLPEAGTEEGEYTPEQGRRWRPS